MRKILVGIVSVAGLLAVVLALSTSPATAAKKVVTITSAKLAGDYTVSWETLGGCNPGAGTSGATGSIVLTVAASGTKDSTPTPGELKGTADVAGVTIDDVCQYKWTGSLLESTTGATCAVGPDPFKPNEQNALTVLAVPGDCTQGAKITVKVNPPVDAADVVDAKAAGAILATVFTATAAPAKDNSDSCSTVTAESTVDEGSDYDSTSDDSVSIELEVVQTTAANATCNYDVTLNVPAGFSTATRANVTKTFPTGQKDEKDAALTWATAPAIGVTVSIATRNIYLVQSVVGDSGGGTGQYSVTKADEGCSTADLPGALTSQKSTVSKTSGIFNIGGATVVELREGRYNITAGLTTDPAGDGGKAAAKDGVGRPALDGKGVACTATASVSDLPDGCTAASASASANLRDSGNQVVLEISIDCTPPAPPPVDTGGEMTGDGDDMGDGGDLMSPDPGDVPADDDTGGDDTTDGPIVDTPTG